MKTKEKMPDSKVFRIWALFFLCFSLFPMVADILGFIEFEIAIDFVCFSLAISALMLGLSFKAELAEHMEEYHETEDSLNASEN